MMDRNRLGYKIRELRQARGLSKSEFSRRVGVTPTAVHNWEENGVVPRQELMGEIAKVLMVAPEGLMDPPSKDTGPDLDSAIDADPQTILKECRAAIASAYRVTSSQVEIAIRL